LERLKHQVNAAMGLSEKNREAKFADIQNQIDQTQNDLENISGTGVNGSGEGGDSKDPTDLKSKKADLKTKIEKFHNKGWITDDLYETLTGDLDKIDVSDPDPDLIDAASTQLDNLQSSVDSIAGLYAENHEAVDQVEGVNNDITEDKLPPELKKLMDLIPQIKGKPDKLIEKLLSAFPELDANNDGVLSAQELKDGVTNKIFPPQRPNNALIKLMTDLDPELKDKWDATTVDFTGDNDGADISDEQKFPRYRDLMSSCNKRLVNLLNAVYGDDAVKMSPNCDSNWHAANDLIWSVDGQTFEAFTEKKTTRDVDVEWYGVI